MGDLISLLAGLSLGGGGSGGASGGGGAGGSTSRHNVGRVPELDYFARKLAGPSQVTTEWTLPFGKAGDVAVGGMPDVHGSPRAYQHTMQAHTALEFQVGLSC